MRQNTTKYLIIKHPSSESPCSSTSIWRADRCPVGCT